MRIKIVTKWITAGFLLLLAAAFCPSWCSLFALFAAILLFPPLEPQLGRYLRPRWKNAILISCVVLTILLVPQKTVPQAQPVDITVTPKQETETREGKETTAKVEAENRVETPIPKEPPKETVVIEPAKETVIDTTVHPNSSAFQVHFIDVGQGDSALVICDDQTMLIDGGTPSCSSLIVSYLRKQGISHLDYIVATHAHEDHIGGLSGALNTCSVGRILSPVTNYDAEAFFSLKKYAEKQGIKLGKPDVGDSFMLGSCVVSVLAPIAGSSDHNDNSIVLKINYDNTSFLFMGDANNDSEHDLINAGVDLSSTVLKVGHHGSEDATSYVFLREVMPKYAVISCGKGNSYGHPTDMVLSRLSDAGVEIFRTDIQGDIVCVSNGVKLTFLTEKQAKEEALYMPGDEYDS